MKVSVLEFACGGGLRDEPPRNPSEKSDRDSNPVGTTTNTASVPLALLFDEGLGMLKSLASDLVACGHEVTVCIDPKIASESSVADLKANGIAIEFISHERPWMESWIATGIKSDRAIVIAPEMGNALSNAVTHMKQLGIHVICSSLPFLLAASDKLDFAARMQRANIQHPQTNSVEEILSGGYSNYAAEWPTLTLKRRDGAGCVGMQRFHNGRMFLAWLNESTPEARDVKCDPSNWIVQPWKRGRSASMAIIASEDSIRVIGACQQFIESESTTAQNGGVPVVYNGGYGPIDWLPLAEFTRFAELILAALPPGAYGWIGIDFLVPEEASNADDLVAIEVNPRLTTSYLGYRQFYGPALANELLGITSGSLRTNATEFRFDA